MDILKALKAEESKLLKKAQTIQAAIKLLSGNSSGNGRRAGRKKWHMSAAAKRRISLAQKARWAAKKK